MSDIARCCVRVLLVAVALALAGCAEKEVVTGPGKIMARPPSQGVYKVGNPYQINGVWYYPAVDYDYDATGIASWYGDDFDGQSTANGETYAMNDLSAAHQTLPLPSMVRVTNLENGREIAVRVNDRGPYANGRIIDVSRRAAQLLGFEQQGTARVRVHIMAQESRVLALQAQGVTPPALAEAASPATPKSAPTTAVTSAALAPIAGAVAAPAPAPAASLPAAPAVKSALGQLAASTPIVPDGRVTTLPVRVTRLYVQAGAFTEARNAGRLQSKLAVFGPIAVTPVRVDGQRFFRVRLGPIATVADGDALLDRVVKAGHPEARLVVD